MESTRNNILIRKIKNLVKTIGNDYFLILAIDFKDKCVSHIYNVEPVAPLIEEYLSLNSNYDDFIKYCLEKYVSKEDYKEFQDNMNLDTLYYHIKNKGKFVISFYQLFDDKNCPVELTVVDVSDNQDGTQAIMLCRFVEDIIKQQVILRKQDDMIKTLVKDYTSIYHIDLDANTFLVLQAQGIDDQEVNEYVYHSLPYQQAMKNYINSRVSKEDRLTMLTITTCSYIKDKLSKEEGYSYRFRVNSNNDVTYYEMRIVRARSNEIGNYAIMSIRNVDDQAKEQISHQLKIEKINDELANALKAAEIANQSKTDFLSRMSHDIRTPLNAIIGVTAIAGTHLNDKDKLVDCLAKINSSSQHLLSIINDILDMSRIESGKMVIHEDEFSLSKMADSILEMISFQAKEKHQNIQFVINKIQHESVIGDVNRIQQAFINILSNAVKYTPEYGNITISMEEKRSNSNNIGVYQFKFEDNGIGMSKEFTKHIFEPFEREEDLRVSKIQGTGLGMAITQNIIHLMGGTIEVESEYGKGSIFTVNLPLQLSQRNWVSDNELLGLPVLVVDDDQVFCESTSIMLKKIGMISEWVLSGREAVEKVILKHQYHEDYFAVIIDWQMPEMDGIETTRQIRKLVGKDVPIIILSAYDWSDIEEEARKAGVDAFISKPVFSSKILHTFRTIMNRNIDINIEETGIQKLEQNDYSNKRILLVEDNELNREIETEIIKITGIQIETAKDGSEAVDMVKYHPAYYYDLILMDVQMPIMDGYQATKAIRALNKEDAKDIPIIAMTANTFEEDIRQAYHIGMNEHLGKPINLTKLNIVLNKWLKKT